MANCALSNCTNDFLARCSPVFDLVHVSYLIKGGTFVSWGLISTFTDPLPHSFQLQVGQTGNSNADDWEDVGLPVENSIYAIDGTQRSWGQIQRTHYRVKLTTSVGTYYSIPTGAMGLLNVADWKVAREIIRKERLRFHRDCQEGYLLKRRISGARCTSCLDLQLDESADHNCTECYGTGYQCGYYYPVPCVWADLSPRTHRLALDQQRGAVAQITVPARMLMLPLLDTMDVWVNKLTDDRYYVHTIQHIAEYSGVPLVAHVELRPAPFSDVVYSVEIPEQIAALEI